MKPKKNPKYILENKRGLFFSMGLSMALAMITMAFEYTSVKEPIVTADYILDPFIDVVIDVKPTRFPEPKPKKQKAIVVQPVVVATKVVELIEEVKVVLDEEEKKTQPFIDGADDGEELPDEIVEDPPLNFAEKMPEPNGGLNAFFKYLGKNLKYPQKARRIGVTGRVTVQFVIGKNGEISEISLLKGIGFGCDEEAIRAIKAYPLGWNAGRQGDHPVAVRMVMPINFNLN